MSGGILHDGEHYRVVFRPAGNTPLTIVYFECWLPRPSREEPPTAEGFFIRRGINFIGIKPARNDWYQQDEILDAIAAVRAATRGAHLVGYGGSMGGYAVINFAHELGLASLLAICPQVSIDRTKVPFERRWAQEAAQIDFRHDRIATNPPLSRGYIMFDPLTDDRLHATAIAARHALTFVPTWFTGHEQLRVLTDTGIAGEVIMGLVQDRLDRADVIRRLRGVRRQSNIVWLGVAKLKLRRGEIDSALRAMLRARAQPLPDPFDAAVTHAEILHRLGHHAEAEAMMADFLSDPVCGPAARWHLHQWRQLVPAASPLSWWRRLKERMT